MKNNKIERLKTRLSKVIEDEEELKYLRIRGSRFKQQRLPAWRPKPTMRIIFIVYLFFGLVFIGIGIMLLFFSRDIQQIEIRYDKVCENKTSCSVNYTIPNDMKRPIMVYYKLKGFYQNHRRYVKSKSVTQLYGNVETLGSASDYSDCDPVTTNFEMRLNSSTNFDNETLQDNKVAIPCGLIAKTYFNDTFSNWTINNESCTVNEKDIAWPKDRQLFRNNDNTKSLQWINMADEHFIVWMRPAGLPDVQKLWGRIENNDLKKGDNLSFQIENNYDVSYYEGQKAIFLSTVNTFGGKNDFLGIAYLVMGGISILACILFPALYYSKNGRRKLKNK